MCAYACFRAWHGGHHNGLVITRKLKVARRLALQLFYCSTIRFTILFATSFCNRQSNYKHFENSTDQFPVFDNI